MPVLYHVNGNLQRAYCPEQIEIAVSKIEIALNKLKLPWHFWATILMGILDIITIGMESRIQVPLTKVGIQYLESGICDVESGIQEVNGNQVVWSE